MSEMEKTLRRGAAGDVAHEAERAALRLAEAAADNGLLDVAYASFDTQVGEVWVASTARGLVKVAFGNSVDPEAFVEDLGRRVSPRVLEAPWYFDAVRHELDEYFEGRRTSFDLPLDWRLTRGFGRRVLRRTARIPYGRTSTYREVAAGAGNERAVRAAGNALGANPLPIVVPCHRVLRTGGALGGYGGGLDIKEYLLRLEQGQRTL